MTAYINNTASYMTQFDNFQTQKQGVISDSEDTTDKTEDQIGENGDETTNNNGHSKDKCLLQQIN